MEDLFDPEELILCPYNNSHRIRRCRMQVHLVKCRVSYGEQKLVSCDFNATHMIAEPELQYHHQTCSDRKKIEARIVDSRTRSEDKFPIPNIQVASEENWDNYNTPSYDPKKYTENSDVLRHLDVASSAKKRNFRMEERQRLSQLNSQSRGQNAVRPSEPERVGVRLPSHPSVPPNIEQKPPEIRQLKEKVKMDAGKVYGLHK